ncbi:MAG TPA: hypothetical protein DD670_01550 [Planctomycetaceae bacterium]|nr:hypothetical protein [Planctomycetaceae bacterium]
MLLSQSPLRVNLTRLLWEKNMASAASVAMHALGRLGEPEDVASMIAWLLDRSNSWVTGQVFGVDGGLGSVRGNGRIELGSDAGREAGQRDGRALVRIRPRQANRFLKAPSNHPHLGMRSGRPRYLWPWGRKTSHRSSLRPMFQQRPLGSVDRVGLRQEHTGGPLPGRRLLLGVAAQ